MRHSAMITVAALTTALGLGCGDLTGGGAAPEAGPVAITQDALPGTVWIFEQVLPGGATRPNPQARVRFYDEGGVHKAQYTVLSLGDVYDYTCEPTGEEEWVCRTPPKVDEICRSLEVFEKGSCSRRSVMDSGVAGLPDAAAIDKVVAEVKAEVDKARTQPTWKQYAAMHNNVANPVEGFFYVKAQPKKDNVRIQDLFATIHDGTRKEDSNPVGTNDFVRGTGEYRWSSCDDDKLVDLSAPDRVKPADIPGQRPHALGDTVHFLYYGETALDPEAGCTYSYDGYAQAVKVASDVAVTPGADGKLDWRAEHAFTDADAIKNAAPSGVASYEMVRFKTCGGERTELDTTCRVFRVQ